MEKRKRTRSIQQQFDFDAKYSHHTKSHNIPVNILVSDSERIFTSEAIDKLSSENGIFQRFSPPN
jgi:hypothetical protein